MDRWGSPKQSEFPSKTLFPDQDTQPFDAPSLRFGLAQGRPNLIRRIKFFNRRLSGGGQKMGNI